MIRIASTAALVLALSAPAVSAAPSGVEALRPAFGNTIVSTYPDGRKARLWLNADGTYKGKGRRGFENWGKWTVKGSKICLKQTGPKSYPFSFCTMIKSGGVGTSWTDKAVTGEKIRVTLVAGR